jgi:uncharacterized protein YfaS (alpha-2-macroglobulin family)
MNILANNARQRLSPYGKALLLAGLAQVGEDSSSSQAFRTMLNDLTAEAVLSAAGVHWEDGGDYGNLDSDIRTTAMVINALSLAQPDSPLLPQALRWLMVARTADHWPTSHETAWSTLALTNWLLASGDLAANYEYQTTLNGTTVATGYFDQSTLSQVISTTIPAANLLAGDINYLVFGRGQGSGNLYYSLTVEAAIPAASVPAASQGVIVQRVYYDAACNPEEFTCEPIDHIQLGQKVRVELTITAVNDLVYAIIEDPIPAGAEAVDPNLLRNHAALAGNVSRTDLESSYRYGYWGWWYFTDIQYRDEKVVFSSDFLPAGTYQYTYYLQPLMSGEF